MARSSAHASNVSRWAVASMLGLGCSTCLVANEDFDGPGSSLVPCEADQLGDNHELDDAWDLGAFPEGADGRVTTGRLTQPGEVDWFSFEGLIDDPEVLVRAEIEAEVELRVCAIVTCSDGTPAVPQCDAEQLGERQACCGVDDLFASFQCPSVAPSTVYLLVDGGPACTDYALQYEI